MDFFDNITQCVAYLEGAGYSRIAYEHISNTARKELWYNENQMFRYAEVIVGTNGVNVSYFHRIKSWTLQG